MKGRWKEANGRDAGGQEVVQPHVTIRMGAILLQ